MSDRALGKQVRVGRTSGGGILDDTDQQNEVEKPSPPTLVQPFILLVIIICGTNFFATASSESFHFSRSGRNAKVSQYGPTALVLKTSMKSCSETPSKRLETYADALASLGG